MKNKVNFCFLLTFLHNSELNACTTVTDLSSVDIMHCLPVARIWASLTLHLCFLHSDYSCSPIFIEVSDWYLVSDHFVQL